jgi:mitogen-activated protein kinase kinase kinase 4
VGLDILHVPDSNKQISKSTPDLSIDSKRQLNKTKSPSDRFAEQCVLLDKHRESSALMRPYIGKILEKASQQQVITAINVNFRWQLGIFIGKGHFGEVYSCVNLENGEPMAVKKIPFKSNDATTIQSIVNEINNIQGLEHENLVKFFGVELHRSEILIFMEYCEQSTLDKISREASGLPERIVREFTKSLLKAVEFLHDKGIMHRDIKGGNIFLKIIDWKYPDKATLKLGDFGCSIKFQDPIGPNKTKVTGIMGTFPYMAPEVMISSGEMDTYTFTADIWSVGCVVVEMFTGKRPWHPLTRENIMYKYIYTEKSKFKPPYPLTISQEAQMFLESCFEFDSSLRPCADKMLDHPFVKVESFDDKYHSI